MKKTIIALALLSCGVLTANASTDIVSSVSFTGGENTYLAGTTYGDLTLSTDMTTGKSASGSITFDPAINVMGNAGSYFGALDHTVSLWVETSSLSSDTLLFGYYAGSTNSCVGYYWNAATSTISFGRGQWNDGQFTYSQTSAGQMENSSSLSSYIAGSGSLTNITIAFDCINQYAHATATVWVNGTEIGTTNTFYTDCNSGPDTNYIVGDATYGTIAITNRTLTTSKEIAGLAIPEPATATLSLLALCGLAARRRRH